MVSFLEKLIGHFCNWFKFLCNFAAYLIRFHQMADKVPQGSKKVVVPKANKAIKGTKKAQTQNQSEWGKTLNPKKGGKK